MALLKKLAQQTALYGISSIAARLLTFVFLTPYLTRVFTGDAGRMEMGIMTDIYAWAAFLIIPFTYRMETALFRFGSNSERLPRAFRTATLSIVISTLIFVTLLISFSQPIANWMEYENLPHYIIWIVLIIGLDALSAIPFALLRLQGKAFRFALIKILHMVIYLGSLLFMMELGPYLKANHLLLADWWYYDLGIGHVFVANLIGNCFMFAFLLPSYFSIVKFQRNKNKQRKQAEQDLLDEQLATKKPKEPLFDWVLWRKMMRYSLPLVIAGFAGIINEVMDRSLLKILLPGEFEQRLVLVGIYGACYKISIFMNLFTQAFNYAAEPFFFKNKKLEASKSLYADIALLFTIVGCVAFLTLTLFMDLVQYFVGPSYREGLVIVPILLIANLFLGIYYNVAAWYKLADKTHFGAIIATVGAIITLSANFVLIPWLGFVGAAWATLLCYFSMVIICYIFGQRIYPIPYNVFKISTYIIIAIAFYGIYQLVIPYIPSPSFLSYSLSSFILLTYVGILWKMDGKQIRQIIKQ